MSHADQFKILADYVEKNFPSSQVQWGEPQVPLWSDHNPIRLLDETGEERYQRFRQQILMEERFVLQLRFPSSPRPTPQLSRRRRLRNWIRRLPSRLIHQ